jgi:hypothetical protein
MALQFKSATAEARTSLQNWVSGTGCLAREETAYLEDKTDLMELGRSGDKINAKLEVWVERILIRTFKGFRQVCVSTTVLRVQS